MGITWDFFGFLQSNLIFGIQTAMRNKENGDKLTNLGVS